LDYPVISEIFGFSKVEEIPKKSEYFRIFRYPKKFPKYPVL